MNLKGLYLVVSPIDSEENLLSATEKALEGGVDIVQFSAGKESADMRSLTKQLASLAEKYGKPFLVNDDWAIAKDVGASGVHFDLFGVTPSQVRETLGAEAIVGYTVNIDLTKINWAKDAGADYISLCSVFHVCHAGACPMISMETVKYARSISKLPVFAAGGITLENAHLLLEAGVDGIVVTSAILKSKDPRQAAEGFKEILGRYAK